VELSCRFKRQISFAITGSWSETGVRREAETTLLFGFEMLNSRRIRNPHATIRKIKTNWLNVHFSFVIAKLKLEVYKTLDISDFLHAIILSYRNTENNFLVSQFVFRYMIHKINKLYTCT